KYSHLLMALGALLAFVPIFSVDYLLDAYIRHRETVALQQQVSQIGVEIKNNVADAVTALRGVVADSPSLCTPTFSQNAQRAIANSLTIKQVLIENGDGVQYCDAYGREVAH